MRVHKHVSVCHSESFLIYRAAGGTVPVGTARACSPADDD